MMLQLKGPQIISSKGEDLLVLKMKRKLSKIDKGSELENVSTKEVCVYMPISGIRMLQVVNLGAPATFAVGRSQLFLCLPCDN